MIRFVLPLVVLILFVLEGTLFQVFAPEQYNVPFFLIPRFVVIVIVITGIYRGKKFGTLYGIISGLFFDVVYTEVLGPYMFTMGLIGYLFSLPYKPIQKRYTLVALLALGAVMFLEYFLYGINYLLNRTSLSHASFFYWRFLPTLGLNFIFLLIILYPLRRFLLYLKKLEKMETH